MSYVNVKVINIAEELGKDCIQLSIFWSTLQGVSKNRLEQLVWSIEEEKTK